MDSRARERVHELLLQVSRMGPGDGKKGRHKQAFEMKTLRRGCAHACVFWASGVWNTGLGTYPSPTRAGRQQLGQRNTWQRRGAEWQQPKQGNSSRNSVCSMCSVLLLGKCPNYTPATANSYGVRNLAFVDATPYGELKPISATRRQAVCQSCMQCIWLLPVVWVVHKVQGGKLSAVPLVSPSFSDWSKTSAHCSVSQQNVACVELVRFPW